MNTEELRKLQSEFEGNRQNDRKKYEKLENSRAEFVKKFPIEVLKTLPIEKYVVGEVDPNKESFCNWLETKLRGLGNIKGATAFKFGVYYGKTKSDPEKKYRFQKRFTSPEEAYRVTKKEVLALIVAGELNDLATIEKIQLTPMFKGKILSTYYPNKYLSIFSGEHLDHFIEKLGIDIALSHQSEVRKRKILVDFKNADEVMRDWATYEFSDFLYSKIGRPADIKQAPIALKEYLLPPFSQVKATYVRLTLSKLKESEISVQSTKPYKTDYELNTKRNKELGDRGEYIIRDKEIEYLKSIGKEDLASKVKRVSAVSDSYGYDILSYDENGNEKYIEVKSTRSDISQHSFGLTKRELETAQKCKKAFYIYMVFNAGTTTPKIFKIQNPFLVTDEKHIKVIPNNYRVLINPVQERPDRDEKI